MDGMKETKPSSKIHFNTEGTVGWCDDAMVLGKLSVPGRNSRTRVYCSWSRCRWCCLDIFFSHLAFLSSFSLSLGDDPI